MNYFHYIDADVESSRGRTTIVCIYSCMAYNLSVFCVNVRANCIVTFGDIT